jgi:hypothetical protein
MFLLTILQVQEPEVWKKVKDFNSINSSHKALAKKSFKMSMEELRNSGHFGMYSTFEKKSKKLWLELEMIPDVKRNFERILMAGFVHNPQHSDMEIRLYDEKTKKTEFFSSSRAFVTDQRKWLHIVRTKGGEYLTIVEERVG